MQRAHIDYQKVCEAIEYISAHWQDQPALDDIAAHMGLSAAHFQKLFTRWAGLSPKEFLQAITIDQARVMLRSSASLLDTAYELGLSGTGRLHDLFLDHEAMTPGDYKRRGAGLTIYYGYHASPFGIALIMATERGLSGLAFVGQDGAEAGGAEGGDLTQIPSTEFENEQSAERKAAFEDMARRWPAAQFTHAPEQTAPYAARIFAQQNWQQDNPLKLVLIGTDFEIRVWQELLKIPPGHAVTYSDIARQIGHEGAARAVGTAVGHNPISFVVPCHRVRRKDGGLGGYHWGLTRKQAIIGWEAGLFGTAAL